MIKSPDKRISEFYKAADSAPEPGGKEMLLNYFDLSESNSSMPSPHTQGTRVWALQMREIADSLWLAVVSQLGEGTVW